MAPIGIQGAALRDAGAGREIVRVAVEALETVVRLERTGASGGRQLGRDVIGDFAEDRLVTVDALLVGQPHRVLPTWDRQQIGEARTVGAQLAWHVVPLVERVGLTLHEGTEGGAQCVFLRGGEAQFMAPLVEVVVADDLLGRIDEMEGVVVEVVTRSIPLVVEERVIAVVRVMELMALQVGARVDHVEVADLAFNRQRALGPRLVGLFRREVGDLQEAHRRVVAEEAIRHHGLAHEGWRDGPVVADVDARLAPHTLGVDRVVVVLDESGVAGSTGADDATATVCGVP